MTTERILTIADLDAYFAKQPAPAAKKPTAKPKQPTKPAAPEKYWIPEAVVLWESQWQCNSGCQGPATPELFVRERQGRVTRLRAIRSEAQFGLLPRFIETAEPSHIQSCPHCFAGAAEFIAQQFLLPFPEEQAVFKTRLTEAVNFAAELDDLFKSLEAQRSGPTMPRAVKRETPLPDTWDFNPMDIEFTGSAIGSDHRSIYHHTVSSEDGPEFQYCWKESQ